MRTSQNKKQVRDANIYIKKSCKIISIFVVFILISTVFSSVVSSRSILNSNDETTDGPVKKLLNKIKDHLSSLREKIQNLRDKLREAIDDNKNSEDTNDQTYGRLPRVSFLSSARTFLYVLKASSTLMFYTNYSGIEKHTELRFLKGIFRETTVDVDGVEGDDISVKITLLPKFFEGHRLGFSVNFNLNITRLDNFPSTPPSPPTTDPRSFFQAYVELYFPGLLIAKQAGDSVRFGYESAVDEVPNSCVVNYKWMPHLLTTKTPEHNLTIDPVEDDPTNNIVMLFNYVNVDDENASQLYSRTSYDPAVKSTMYMGGEGILGGSTYEFSGKHFGDSRVNLTCLFESNNTNIIHYVNDVPKKISFSGDLGKQGFMQLQFDMYDGRPSEVGICNNLTDPTGVNTSRVFITNVPEITRLSWDRKLLDDKKANVTFYTQGAGESGIAVNGHFALPENKTIDFNVSSNGHLNSYLELDFEQKYLVLSKSAVNLNVSLSAKGSNNGTFDLSFDLEHSYEKPFQVFFGELNETKISLANQTYVISNFYFLVQLDKESGPVKIGLRAEKIVKEREGNVTISLRTIKDDGNITFNVTMIVENGLSITGLQLCFNGAWTMPPRNIDIEGTVTRYFEIFLQVSDFEYFVAEDGSWGYFFFKGSMSYDTYREFICNNILGGFKGHLYMQSGSNGLNISWYKVNESGQNLTKVNVTGMNFGLSDFHFYYGEVINVYIPNFTGSIQIIETCRKSGDIRFDMHDSQSFLDINLSFNFSQISADSADSGFEFGLTCDDLHIDHPETSLSFELAWNEKNISSLRYSSETNLNFSIDKLDIRLASKGVEIFKLENMTGHATGYAGLNIDLTLPLKVNTSDGWYFDLANSTLFSFNLTNVDAYLYIQNLSVLQLGRIVIDANVTGTAKFSIVNVSNEIFNVTGYNESIDISLLNLTIEMDAQDGLADLRFFEIENIGTLLLFVGVPVPFPMPIILENISIHGHSDITFSIKTNSTVGLGPICGLDILVENEADTEIYIGKFFCGLTLYGLSAGLYAGNLSMTEGIVYLIIDIITKNAPLRANLKVPEAMALQSFEIGLEVYPDLAKVIMTVNPPLEYFNVELNMGIDSDEAYILVDTKNTSATADFYSIFTAEIINMGIDWWNSHSNLTMPHVQDDVGLWIDNVTLRADEFYVYLDSLNISGYLNVTGSGNIYRLDNGTWVPLLPDGDGFTIVVFPGHIQMIFDIAGTYTVYLHEDFENGDEVTLAANITVISNNLTIDIWWNLFEGDIRIDLSKDNPREFAIEDFMYELIRNSEGRRIYVAWSSFSLVSGNSSLILDYINKDLKLILDGALVTWDGFDLEFVNVPIMNFGNWSINLSWDHLHVLDGNIVFQTVVGSSEYTWNIESNRYMDWFELVGMNGSLEGVDNPMIHFEAGIGLIKWNKSANNSFKLNLSQVTNGGSIKIDRHANVDSTFVVEDAYVKFIGPIVEFPWGGRLRSFTANYQRTGHEYLYIEWLSDEYVNLTADIAATWNISFERFFGIMNAISSIDFVSSSVDMNLSLHYEPAADNFTAGHIDFNVLDTSSLELLEIINYYLLAPDKILSIASLELEPGQISLDWLINPDTNTGCLFFNNTDVTIEFSGLTLKKGIREITILEATKYPGQLYLEFNLSEKGYLYINGSGISLTSNVLAYFTLLNISRGFDFIGIEKDVEVGIIEMKPGQFNASWEKLSSGDDYDNKTVIKNGVFEVTAFKITRKIGNLEFFITGRDTVRNYENTITLKFRNRGDKNRALFVDSTSHVQFARWSVGVSTSNWNLQLNLFEIKLDFNEFYIGYFDQEFDFGGILATLLTARIKFINISFSWKDQNEEEQEIFTQYCEEYNNDPQTNAFVLDSANCTEDLTINFDNFEAGNDSKKLKLNGDITIHPQKHLIVHFDANPEPRTNPQGQQVIDGHVFVDTNNQAMGDLTVEAKIFVGGTYNVYVGLGAEINVLSADDFYVYGELKEIFPGIWLPSNWVKSGDIILASGRLYFIYGDEEIELWPCEPQAVLDKTSYAVSELHPQVTFDTSGSDGYIFELKKMRWDWDGDGDWDTGLHINDHWIDYSEIVTQSFSVPQQPIQIHFQVKTLFKESAITSATIIEGNDFNIEIAYNGDVLFEGDLFKVYVNDSDTGNPISDANVVYWQEDAYGHIDINDTEKTDAGVVEFTAFDVVSWQYIHTSDAKIYVQRDGYIDGESDYFLVHDRLADIHGYDLNLVTHKRIGGTMVVAQPGNYVVYSPPQSVNAPFRLFVPEGTYTLTISKSGYETITIEDVTVEEGDYLNLGDLYLPPLSYGGIHGHVYDEQGDSPGVVDVTVKTLNGVVVAVGKSDYFLGYFPKDYQYYAFDVPAGTYIVEFTSNDYYTKSTTVTVNNGEITEMSVTLKVEWYSPDSHSDPNSGWNDETYAYDESENTCAVSDRQLFQGWTNYIYLTTTAQVNCDKIRFYAFYDEDYCYEIDLDVYYGGWHDLYQGPFANKAYVVKNLGGTYQATQARVRFYILGAFSTTADLYELDFHRVIQYNK